MNSEVKLIEAIRTATNGTFIGSGGMSTLMGSDGTHIYGNQNTKRLATHGAGYLIEKPI